MKWLLILALVTELTRGEPGAWERPLGMPNIKDLQVMCGSKHMEVHLSFDVPFHGMVAAKGMYGHENCVYVRPRTGNTNFVFNIDYNNCGTKPDNHGKFFENTIVVQYDEELIEAWDEAKRLRCEWFNDYEKTATKTNPMVISDLDIVELNFHGDNVDCWMEIQEGKGPWAKPLNGIVPLGSPLTMVVAVKDPTGEFDMRVKQCEASDGLGGHVLPLSDLDGCILRPKLLGKFSKVKLDDAKATVLTYAYISAFKFPDMLNVHLRCTVEICRHGCPEHCSNLYPRQHAQSGSGQVNNYLEPMAQGSNVNSIVANLNGEVVKEVELDLIGRKPIPDSGEVPQPQQQSHPPQQQPPQQQQQPPQQHQAKPPVQQPIPAQGPVQGGPSPHPPQVNPPINHNPMNRPPPPGIQGRPLPQPHPHHYPPMPHHLVPPGQLNFNYPPQPPPRHQRGPPFPQQRPKPGRLQKEPRGEESRNLRNEPQAQALNGGAAPAPTADRQFPNGPRNLRVRRATNTIAIQSAFKVVSQADLNFLLNSNTTDSFSDHPNQIPLTKGIPIFYGICLPRFAFAAAFLTLGLATLISILIAGVLAYAHFKLNKKNEQVFPMVIFRKIW